MHPSELVPIQWLWLSLATWTLAAIAVTIWLFAAHRPPTPRDEH